MEVFLYSAPFQQQSFQTHTGGAVRCKAPPQQHMILWPVFFSVADFWTLTVGCFCVVRAKKSWKLFRGYRQVRIFTSHSVLHGQDSMASRTKGWLAPTSPLGSPSPPFPIAFLLQIKNIWIWRSGPCNFFFILLTFAQLLDPNDSLGRGRTQLGSNIHLYSPCPSSPAQPSFGVGCGRRCSSDGRTRWEGKQEGGILQWLFVGFINLLWHTAQNSSPICILRLCTHKCCKGCCDIQEPN